MPETKVAADRHTPARRLHDHRRRVRMRAIVAWAVMLAIGAPLVATAATAPVAAPWWPYPIALAGAVLVGLVAATYFGAPPGADATVCDLRWPIFGLIGVILSVDPNGRFLSDLFSATGAGIARPIIGVAALALLAWALRDRLTRERAAVAAADAATHDPDVAPSPGATCTTCTPLFPASTKAGPNTRP